MPTCRPPANVRRGGRRPPGAVCSQGSLVEYFLFRAGADVTSNKIVQLSEEARGATPTPSWRFVAHHGRVAGLRQATRVEHREPVPERGAVNPTVAQFVEAARRADPA